MIDALSLALGATSTVCAIWCVSRSTPGQRGLYNNAAGGTFRLRRASVCERIGRKLRRLAHRGPNPTADRELGRTVVLAVILALVQPLLAIAVVVALRVRSVLVRRRRAQERVADISNGLAEVIELFAIALVSGATVGDATHQVSRWAGGEFGQAFLWCERQVAHGRTLADALELVPERLGPQVRPLIAALVATERYGAPIAQSLMQLGADSRADRRRRAETAARRLPVALLFPLVLCVLPAFLLLTIVPVVADSVSKFDLVGSL